jgi:hypothetical protein
MNQKDVVYVRHHLGTTYPPLQRNDFVGCHERCGQL